MGAGFKRRELLKGTLVAGAMLALPGRAAAQALSANPDFNAEFDSAFAPKVAPNVPAQPSGLTAYQTRIMQIAARERDRAGDALWRRDVVAVADFAQPSSLPRLHFADLDAGARDVSQAAFAHHG